MRIYGIDVSFPTHKVRYLANAIGLSYEFTYLMPFSPEAEAPDYRAGPRQRGVIDQWMGFTSIHVGGAIARVFLNTLGVKFSDWYPVDRSFGQRLTTGLLAQN